MSLVPIGAPTVDPRFALAGYAARAAYDNRDILASMARGGYRAGRYAGRKAYRGGRALTKRVSAYRSKRRKISRVGKRVGQATAKRQETVNDTVSVFENTRTFYVDNLLRLDKQTTADELNLRNRDIVNFRGVKICTQIKNNQDYPITLNWCVLVPPSIGHVEALSVLSPPNASHMDSTLSFEPCLIPRLLEICSVTLLCC